MSLSHDVSGTSEMSALSGTVSGSMTGCGHEATERSRSGSGNVTTERNVAGDGQADHLVSSSGDRVKTQRCLAIISIKSRLCMFPHTLEHL
jgi:hypothetical protein